jgi:hypothetical protein
MRMVRDDRSGDVVVVTEPPFTFSWLPGLAGYLRSALYVTGLRSFGGHGYDPRHPDMGGIFFALGRGVPADLVLSEVQQVDL